MQAAVGGFRLDRSKIGNGEITQYFRCPDRFNPGYLIRLSGETYQDHHTDNHGKKNQGNEKIAGLSYHLLRLRK